MPICMEAQLNGIKIVERQIRLIHSLQIHAPFSNSTSKCKPRVLLQLAQTWICRKQRGFCVHAFKRAEIHPVKELSESKASTRMHTCKNLFTKKQKQFSFLQQNAELHCPQWQRGKEVFAGHKHELTHPSETEAFTFTGTFPGP